MTLGDNIERRRKELDLTQQQLAVEVGVSQQAIGYFETGKKIPSLAVAEQLAKCLQCTIDELLK